MRTFKTFFCACSLIKFLYHQLYKPIISTEQIHFGNMKMVFFYLFGHTIEWEIYSTFFSLINNQRRKKPLLGGKSSLEKGMNLHVLKKTAINLYQPGCSSTTVKKYINFKPQQRHRHKNLNLKEVFLIPIPASHCRDERIVFWVSTQENHPYPSNPVSLSWFLTDRLTNFHLNYFFFASNNVHLFMKFNVTFFPYVKKPSLIARFYFQL